VNAVDWVFAGAFILMAGMAARYRELYVWWVEEAHRQYDWIDEIAKELEGE